MANNEYRSPKIVPLSEDSTIKKSHPFALFIGIWFSFLILAIVLFLGKFRQYLVAYEAEYQASLPFHNAEAIVAKFQENDMVYINDLQTNKPEISEFETEENLYRYMSELTMDKEISYAKTNEFTNENPEYFITADRYIIAKLKLKKSTTETRKYKLPVWETEFFEFYTDAQHTVRVSCPDNCKLMINGIEVPSSYCYKNDRAKGGEYFGDTITLPNIRTFYVDGLYEEATVTATSADGTLIEPKMNPLAGMYEVPFRVNEECEEEMLTFMENAAFTYTHYVANDASIGQTSVYFMPGTNYLQMVEYGETRKYYPWHRIQSEEAEIVEFNPYDADHFYCQMDIHQVLLVRGTEEKKIDTECRFSCIRTANGFKICGLEY